MDPEEETDLDRAIRLLADIYTGGYTPKMIMRVAVFLAEMNVEFYAEGYEPEKET